MFVRQGWELSSDATDSAIACITKGWGLMFVVCQLMQSMSHLQKVLSTLCFVKHRNSYSFAVCEVQ